MKTRGKSPRRAFGDRHDGKPHGLKDHINRQHKGWLARVEMSEGRSIETAGDDGPRLMIGHDRTRLTDPHYFFV